MGTGEQMGFIATAGYSGGRCRDARDASPPRRAGGPAVSCTAMGEDA